MAYEVDAAQRQVAFADALQQLAADPWAGEPYHPQWSPEFRTITFAGSGLATYVVSDRKQAALVEHAIWTSCAIS